MAPTIRAHSPTMLNQISKEGIVDGLSIDQSTIPSNTCEACIQAKQAHKPFPKEAQNRSKEPGERVMSDVWGPARVESIGQWKWYISFVDNCTRFGTVLFLKQKSDATGRIKEHLTKIEKELRSHFEVKSLGQPSLIIAIKIRQGDHIIKLSQTHYINQLLSKYRLQDTNPVSTPMDVSVKLDDPEEKSDEEKSSSISKFGYMNLIGSLMYLAITY